MSWETQSWAAKQRPGSASAKLVLLGLASCADANHCAFPSIQWLCDFSDLNRKTVIAALQRLEDGMFPMITDTGERRGRTGQVKVYRLAAGAEGAASDPVSETVPKTEQFQNRNSSAFSGKESQKRDTEPFREPIPPSLPNGREAPTPPKSKKVSGKGTRLDDDWEPPAIDDLPPTTRALVRQWPSGAYAMVCDVFRCHFRSENGPQAIKRDWTATLAKWLTKDHAKIMRDAKAGVSFAAFVPAQPSGSAPAAPRLPVAAQAREDARSEAMRTHLRRDLGETVYRTWIEPVAVIWDAPGVVVVTGSEFQRSWIEDRFQQQIMTAARAVIGSGVRWARFQVEDAQSGREGRDQ